MRERLHLWGLIILAVGLSTSNFLMSIGVFWLLGNWVYHNSFPKFDLHNRFLDFFKDRAALLVTSIFLMHALGLLYTSDFAYAFKDMRIKLPLLALPIILSTSPKLSAKRVKTVLYFLIGGVFFSTVVSILVYLRVLDYGNYIDDIRDISVFISHIRFSLLICLSIFLVAYLLWVNHTSLKPVYVFIILWFLVFLYIMESATGFVILTATTIGLLGIVTFRAKSWPIRATALIILAAVALGSIYYVKSTWEDYFEVNQDLTDLDEKTIHGERYVHNKDYPQVENGNYVWIYWAPGELTHAWNERSDIALDSVDAKGQPMLSTVARYMTSKGLRKDREGVYQLSKKDIERIEMGDASVKDPPHGLRRRLNAIFYEINNYRHGGNPSGNSVTQRLEFWKTATSIIKQNPVIGVGTGDVQNAFEAEYERSNTKLDRSKWFRSHNQFLTIGVAFGILGLIWFIIALLGPLFINRKFTDYYMIVFMLIAVMSFLAEDTLETQAGVTFFAFFYSFFLLGRKSEGPKPSLHS